MYFDVLFFFFFQAEDGIRDKLVTGVQTCALPISRSAPEPAALGAGGGAALAGRRADGHPGRRARACGPAHLRALVHARRPPVAAALPRRGPRAVRPPPAAGPGVHDRGRGEASRLRAGPDAAAARPGLPGTHRGRDAAVAQSRRGAGAGRAALPHAAARGSFELMTEPGPLPLPRPPLPTLLVVDDEPSLRRVLERALGQVGFLGNGAASAETAYDLLASEPADAGLLDIQLPTMSGLALYLAIVHRWPSLEGRIAIMTGDAEADDVRTWLERHPCTLIRKPFTLREVADWLGDVLRRRPERERGKAGA